MNRHQPTGIELMAVEADAPADDDITTHEPSPRRRGDAERQTTSVAMFVQNNPLRSRRKVIRLLIAFVVTFAVCMLPNHVWLLWQSWADMYQQYESQSYQQYEYNSYEQYMYMYVPPVMTLLFYVNSCLNPFLYALISDKFRSAVSEVDCLRRCCRRRHADDLRCVAKSVPPPPPPQPGEESL